MAGYDMCVDYEELCLIEEKLTIVEQNLNGSTLKMIDAVQRSQGFLAGNQFEKARETTQKCTELTRKTQANIRYAVEFVDQLKNILDEYSSCGYKGDTK